MVVLLVGVVTAGVVAMPAAAATDAGKAPAESRVSAVAAMLPDQPAAPGCPSGCRDTWAALLGRSEGRAIIDEAITLLDQPAPEITADDFLDFSRTGNRQRCQAVMADRRHRLTMFVLAETLEDRGRFLPALTAAIRSTCRDRTWVYPAHDRRLDNFEGRVIDIDLNAAHTGWNLAIATAWLGTRLDRETSDLIRRELERRIFMPYEEHVHLGRPAMWWTTVGHNWNAVCHAGVVGAALAVIESRERRAWFVVVAEDRLEAYLDGFTPDGYCSEGVGYWNYGFGNYVSLAETLHQATAGRLDLLVAPEVRMIAKYPRRIEILPGVYPAFSDCMAGTRPDPLVSGCVNRRLGLPLSAEERQSQDLALKSRSLSSFGLFAVTPPPVTDVAHPVESPPIRDWFADAGVLVCRPSRGSRAFGVALKGGHNAEFHNHNDVGSYVVALDADTPLVDPGTVVYTAATFGPQRYDEPLIGSFGHPVPVVAGRRQRAGRDAAARVLQTSFTDDEDRVTFDIRSCYDVSTLQRLERTFTYTRGRDQRLIVSDHVTFTAPESFGTALATFVDEVIANDSEVTLGAGRTRVHVQITADGGDVHTTTERLDADVRGGRPPTRIGIDFRQPVRQAVISVTIRPLE